jgi:ABC-type nickel/cobalt efflux system permease component RcnA
LISVGFLYGFFHAAGPGHGKAVVASYLLAHERAVRSGLAISALAALLQGVVAIAVVEGVVGLLGLAVRDARAVAGYVETAAFGLTAGLGPLLAGRSVAAILHRRRPHGGHKHAGHDHAAHDGAHRHAAHASPSDHQHCSHHVVDLERARRATGRSRLGVVLAVGLRPCTGAVLVLVLANAFDMRMIGIAAVLAMSLGTAVAVCGLALLTLGFRHVAVRFTGARSPATMAIVGHGLALAGGLFILVFGATLLIGSLGGAPPLSDLGAAVPGVAS